MSRSRSATTTASSSSATSSQGNICSYLLLFGLGFLLQGLLHGATALATAAANRTQLFAADAGDNVTLRCEGQRDRRQHVNWIWGPTAAEEEGEGGGGVVPSSRRFLPQPDGDLLILLLQREDSREYICQDAESNESIHTVLLQVRTVPPAVTNLSVAASSVYALVTWAPLPDDGGHPVTHFRLSYRKDRSHLSMEEEKKEETLSSASSSYAWTILDDVNATATSRTVYHLSPNCTYYFRICAVNKLGCGYVVTVPAKTTFVAGEVEEAKKLLNLARGEEEEEQEGKQTYWKVWVIVTSGFFITFAIIGFGISLLLIKNWGKRRSISSSESTEEEAMELVPHITLNPSFNIEMLEFIEPSEESSSAHDENQLIQIDEGEEVNLVNSPVHHSSGSTNSLHRLNG